MRLLPSSKGLAVTASALAITLALGSPAYAQTANEPDPPETLQGEVETESGQNADAAGDEQIVVTGSRIRRPNLDSTVPITSVGLQELTDTGDVSLGDSLNDLPSLRSTFSQGNSTRFIGTAGLNLLDLRGLGNSRTLVLVNNRRHITASPGDYLVDVNTIPTDLIERVDIVTGGNSAIYGSDAVAGVVNFVMKRDFEGIRIRGQGGISDEGDRGTYFGSITGGHNFAEGRGNVALAFEYAKANPLYFVDRDSLTGAFSGRNQFQTTEITAGEPGGSDGIFDTTFLTGIRNALIADGGAVTATGCTVANAAANPGRCLPNGLNRLFVFDAAGNLVPNNPIQDFRSVGSNNTQGGLGSTLNNSGQLAAGLQRYAVNLLARYEISPAIRPFLEAKFVHVDAIQESGPSFIQGPSGDTLGFIPCDNAYLTAQNLADLRAIGRCTNPAAPVPFDQVAFGAAPIAGTFIPIGRNNVDFGGRGEIHDRDTYRIVAGLEGDFNDDWRYELSVNYGEFRSKLKSLNNLVLTDVDGNPDGFLLAADAVRNGGGQIVCRVNADADPSNDAPDCVPINLLGSGMPSRAALDYVNTTSSRKEKATEFVVSAFVSGDISQLFSLPGGPIGFALGAEYRRETAMSVFDELTAAGGTFLNAIQPFNPPSFEVKEAFGEIRLPLLRDLPFAQELTIEAAGRVSDYKGSTGTVFAYNVGGTYAPVSDIRFRANYSTSVRAPTQSDLFSPQSQNFAFIADPCDINNINNGPNRLENCRALGIAVDQPGGFVNVPARAATLSYTSGGNPLLTEERSKSYTIGGAFTPRFFPGFSATVDYYHINVKDLISVLGAQAIINECVDQATIDNPFCTQVFRDPATGFFEQPVAVISGGVNFAKQITEGVDFEFAYRKTLDNGHRINLRSIATYVMRLDNFTNPSDPTVPNRQLSELGDPRWAFNLSANYDFGSFDLGYSMRYIGKQTILTYEAQNAFNGNPPTNLDGRPVIYYPEVMYHNIRLGYEVAEDFGFYLGVDNVFDRMPPYGLLGTAGGDPYDNIGRFFYAGARVDF